MKNQSIPAYDLELSSFVTSRCDICKMQDQIIFKWIMSGGCVINDEKEIIDINRNKDKSTWFTICACIEYYRDKPLWYDHSLKDKEVSRCEVPYIYKKVPIQINSWYVQSQRGEKITEY
jgi:hypothetical protein